MVKEAIKEPEVKPARTDADADLVRRQRRAMTERGEYVPRDMQPARGGVGYETR